jgi:hypothetical protein
MALAEKTKKEGAAVVDALQTYFDSSLARGIGLSARATPS